jgi:hypothetical protein
LNYITPKFGYLKEFVYFFAENKTFNDYPQLRDNALKGQKLLAQGNALW